jgi:hypothetical protein
MLLFTEYDHIHSWYITHLTTWFYDMIFSGLYAGDRSLIYHYLKGAFFRSLVLKPYKLDISPINSSSMSTCFHGTALLPRIFSSADFHYAHCETAWYAKGFPMTFRDASHGMTNNYKKQFKKAGICTKNYQWLHHLTFIYMIYICICI